MFACRSVAGVVHDLGEGVSGVAAVVVFGEGELTITNTEFWITNCGESRSA